ncbi:DUF3231 family protein [Cohnella sp. CBP 2801]|uniref:DUF3231 family protein n=1 Tax=Cohnella zeiphila TaxID=2761120 RepID=A0A7X0SPH4_9BACL|nr:DUF3231 family protein [Cohnella zeiphila]
MWTSYMSNSLAVCMNKYALQIIEDPNIRKVHELALQVSEHNVKQIARIFQEIRFPVPDGFNENDVNLNAPRLFTDHYHLFYLHVLTIHGLSGYSLALTVSESPQVRQFNIDAYTLTVDLYNKTLELMQNLGIYDHFPQIPTPDTFEYAEKQSYLAGWIGEQRPLNVMEITSIYANLRKSIMLKTLAIGFSQTAESQEVRAHMARTIDLAAKHIELWSGVLHDDYLDSAVTYDTHVTDSQIAPFSDKLMMVHGGFLIAAAMTYYGTGMATGMRRDLAPHYAACIARDAKVAEDGMNILIKNHWYEQPPQAANRKALSKPD